MKIVSYVVLTLITVASACTFAIPTVAQDWLNSDDDSKTNRSMFRLLEEAPDPNEYRSASGAPGSRYWQQKADYVIQTALDTTSHTVTGSETITYHNNSPDVLRYVWIQLDQNVRSIKHSRAYESSSAVPENIPANLREFFDPIPFDGGFELSSVAVAGEDGTMRPAKHIINDTVMKVYLQSPLLPGTATKIGIDWSFIVPDDGRGAKELVADGWMYEIAQWFPRLSVYDDINGWQTDQFMGRGEFYLEFGDYDVTITVPWNHIVQATGTLQNPQDVLTQTQVERLGRAMNSSEPVFVVEPQEVMTHASRPKHAGNLSWRFTANNVRDFAWVSSKTYVWDAMGYRYRPDEKPIELHSVYPRDAMPLWDEFSTKAIAQTMDTYGRMSFEYPYPKAVNVHGPIFGMEYPMIAFCGARPQPDGSYTDDLKRALISVTIHEVGHNWFPMIVASDERKWTWMDEGVNSFLQYYAELDWDSEYPTRRGPARNIVGYMLQDDQVPIMTESDVIPGQTFGNNGYAKPAAGLVMLREQILGPELFDEAFREYSQNWAFKHPQPHDFFRSIEEGAGENLAWFWRGWFFSTHFNDQAIDGVSVEPADSVSSSSHAGKNYYRVAVSNKGGLVLPIQMLVSYDDGSSQMMSMPADVWRTNEKTFRKGFFSDKTVVKVELDPDAVLADVNMDNNVWVAPEVAKPSEVETTNRGDQ